MSLEFTWRVSAELGDTRRARDWGWLGEASWRPAHRTGLHSHHHPTHTVSHRQFVSSFVTQFFLVTTYHILSHISTIIHHPNSHCHCMLSYSSPICVESIVTQFLHVVTTCHILSHNFTVQFSTTRTHNTHLLIASVSQLWHKSCRGTCHIL